MLIKLATGDKSIATKAEGMSNNVTGYLSIITAVGERKRDRTSELISCLGVISEL